MSLRVSTVIFTEFYSEKGKINMECERCNGHRLLRHESVICCCLDRVQVILSSRRIQSQRGSSRTN